MDEPKKTDMPIVGNFPIDQFQIEYLDQATGELTFRRISQQDRYLNKAGQEIPDPRPAAPALGKIPETNIRDYIKTLVRNERLQQELDAQGVETFEEANDFEVGEDYFPDSEYENDLEPSVAELIREGTASLSAKARAQEKREHNEKLKGRQERSQEDNSPPQEPSKKRRKARDPAQDGDLDQEPTETPAD